MRALHHDTLFSWSAFDEARNIDFNGLAIVHEAGNILVDPMPMSPHDLAHLKALGGASTIVLTTSDHVRATQTLRALLSARVLGPAAEADTFPIPCDGFLTEGDTVAPGLLAFALDGSKTPGELALLYQGHTLITGDLIRCHRGGSLTILPAPKLSDVAAAHRSVRRLAALPDVDAVLVGDGWPVFRDGRASLQALAATL